MYVSAKIKYRLLNSDLKLLLMLLKQICTTSQQYLLLLIQGKVQYCNLMLSLWIRKSIRCHSTTSIFQQKRNQSQQISFLFYQKLTKLFNILSLLQSSKKFFLQSSVTNKMPFELKAIPQDPLLYLFDSSINLNQNFHSLLCGILIFNKGIFLVLQHNIDFNQVVYFESLFLQMINITPLYTYIKKFKVFQKILQVLLQKRKW
ncbi:unnamed protein product (macronuclear) [Paramecium tetraurelia]|uniref:Transmembrane protein n=1 Tax=Paramecium tetraurelia TaxID=5888 RepID=A0CQ24_PARTE|nr:uncharacterized protein GSPATT00009239001 [Paramecium tetraurelia]CAK72891.1 unnamed protein product [Paramecium tetraurelia]|eukprot:XP_001440288.1 hypothetical protein (macronuclear) [Paramecium tetraurelia strain d4-2]